MLTSRRNNSVIGKVAADQSGQAMLEFAIIASLGIILVFAIVDFGRAFNEMQVMIGLTRQGSNLASRGTTLSDSAKAVVAGDAPLDLHTHGEIIVTSVTNNVQGNVITGQISQGGVATTSRIGVGVGAPANIPAAAAAMLKPG